MKEKYESPEQALRHRPAASTSLEAQRGCTCQPTIPVSQPAISGGSVFLLFPRTGSIPTCPTERAVGTPLSPASILVYPTLHPTGTMSSLSLPSWDQQFARGGRPGPALLKDALSQCNIRNSIRPVIPLSFFLSVLKFFLTSRPLSFLTSHPSYPLILAMSLLPPL